MTKTTMTLAQVRDALRSNCRGNDLQACYLDDAIDAHLTQPSATVSDEDVERALKWFYAWTGRDDEGDAQHRVAMHAAIEADRAAYGGNGTTDDLVGAIRSYLEAERPMFHKTTFSTKGPTSAERAYYAGARDRLHALLAQGQGGVRDGWVLVPIEPTQAMLDAHSKKFGRVDTRWCEGDIEGAWEAMLAEAPQHGTGD